jgi:hypothetical protein
MSLILRRECQEVLDAADLHNFHVEIINKYLAIVGECGKPLVTISGIQFSRGTPSKAEIPYAVELFNAFVTKYKLLFEEFTKIKADLSLLPIFETAQSMTVGDTNYCLSKRCEYRISETKIRIEIDVNNWCFVINSNNEITKIQFKADQNPVPVQKFAYQYLPDDVIDFVKDWLAVEVAREELENKKAKVLKDIQTCKI